jgi:AICAR transformylase/IMP cyclohydrolase PurH
MSTFWQAVLSSSALASDAFFPFAENVVPPA